PRVSHEEGVRYSLEAATLYGTPRRVAEQVAELRDAGARHVLCQMSYGYLQHARIMESMRDFGEQVMPRFRWARPREERLMDAMRALALDEITKSIAGATKPISVLWQTPASIAFVARGRELRSEFHVDPSDEVMYMIKGDMALHYR